MRKTAYASQLSVVSLGSRKSLCSNEAVRGLGGSERVNEACLELQAKGEGLNPSPGLSLTPTLTRRASSCR